MMVVAAQTTSQDAELIAIIKAYNEVTDRLKQSHEMLRSEVCRLRDELHEKNKELQRRERLAALGQMAAGVAHEIRNPLGGIRLYTSLLEKDLVDRMPQLDIVRKIAVGVRNMENIVGDILAFASGSEPRYECVTVAGVVESVIVQAADRVAKSGARIVPVDSSGELRVVCDPGQIERALINLVFNGLDAAGDAGHVWLRTRSEDGWCVIDIEDDGPGLDPEQAQRVFNPFFTTKDHGTGLGLAIVHRIAESHGGSVRAGRREGGGAAFTLKLPLERPKAGDAGDRDG